MFISCPMIHHLNPSIIPTMGLIEYKSFHFWGITSLEKPTGETYNPNETIKGTMCLKSLYFTLRADKTNPNPKIINNYIIIKIMNKEEIRRNTLKKDFPCLLKI